MALRAGSLASELAKLVVEALVQIGLTEPEVLGGAIEHTNLPWQIPPLVVEAPIFGVALSEYLNQPTHVNVDALMNLYGEAMVRMRNSPGKVLTPEGYRLTSYAIPHVRGVERQLYFSVPDGFPGGVSDYAGIMLSLECAHLLRSSAKFERFESDDDNYYAELPGGMVVGVIAGLPAIGADQWDISVTGMVQEMLRTPRGAVWEGCDYNVTSKVRSVVHTYQKAFRDFEAVDWALQTLRVVNGESALLNSVRRLKNIAYERTARMEALSEAVHVMQLPALSDRQKVEALKNLLVPDILTTGQFSKQLYNFYAVPPPIFAEKVMTRIVRRVMELRDEEAALYARALPAQRFNIPGGTS